MPERLTVIIVGVLAALLTSSPWVAPASASRTTSNVVLIVTDDQRWDSLVGMPQVRRHLAARGVTFRQAFVVNPLCCPSRTSILTGLYSHSTGVYRQAPPFGRFEAFDDRSTLATWLDDAGYRTGMVGKYVDGGQSMLLDGYVPPGWDSWFAFVRSAYGDFAMSRDGEIERFGAGTYSTDLLADDALRFLEDAGEDPFFLVFAPVAPHAPATPAPRHATARPELATWPGPAVDETDVSDKPAYVRALPPLRDEGMAAVERFRLEQARSLLAVDDAVGRIVDELRRSGRLADTLIVFTSDNGIAYGEHRWTKKEVPYEESIRVPMVIRADRLITDARTDDHLVLNIDLAPTIAAFTGLDAPPTDGVSLVPLLRDGRPRWRRDFLVEHLEGTNPVPTYCAVRSSTHLYVEYRSGDRELYDLVVDPAQLRNLAGTGDPAQVRLAERLDELCDPPPPDVPPLRSERATSRVTLGLALVAVAGVAGAIVLAWRRVRSMRA